MSTLPLRNILILPLYILIFISFVQKSAANADRITHYVSRTTDGNSIILTDSRDSRLRITPYGASIVRIQSVRKEEDFFPDDRYEMVESHSWPGNFTVTEDSVSIILRSEGPSPVAILIEKDPMAVSFSSGSGLDPFLTQDTPIRWAGDTITASFAYDPQEHFTGLGHGYFGRALSIDLRGTVVRRNYGTAHGEQAPLIVPFFLSGKGYGLFLNSSFPNAFNFGAESRYECSIVGPGRMDYFVILGPGFREIMDRYTQLTGRPRMFPRSALGLALSDKGNDHSSPDPSDESWWKRKISAHRNAGFPLDHIVNDNRWRAGGGQRCLSRFEWDRSRFPDPAEYQRWVRRNGLIVTLDLNRCIASHSDGWLPSYNIPKPEGIDFNDSAPDLTRPEVRDWFWDLFWRKSLDPALGYPGDALWIDEFDEMGKAPTAMVLGNGRSWQEMRNYWFFLISKALVQDGWDKSAKKELRPFVWVRGMTAGGQRYATLWSGDIKPSYEDMKSQVRGMQLAGLSGFPLWGHDAGGFNNWEENRGPDDTMYRQWSMAFSSFSPFWKPHGIGRSRWPLDRPEEVRTDALKYSRLRYMLMPYLYTHMHHSYEKGIPIARAMVIDHQNDPQAWRNDLQYMWGDAMLVAPNCSDSNSVNIWFPNGDWFNFWNDSLITGGDIRSFPSPVGTLPLFIKAGSIIPMGPFALSTAFLRKDSVTYHVYTGQDAAFDLYEDDGITEAYRTPEGSRRTSVSYRQSDRSLTIAAAAGTYAGAADKRSVQIVLHGVHERICYALNGKRLPFYRTVRETQRAAEGMVWDPRTGTMTIIVKQRSVNTPISLTSIAECP